MVKDQSETIANNAANYCAVVPLTFEERVKIYMKAKKEDLARMLAQRDELEFGRVPQIVPQPVPYVPTVPDPVYPYNPYPWITWYATNDSSSVSSTAELKG